MVSGGSDGTPSAAGGGASSDNTPSAASEGDVCVQWQWQAADGDASSWVAYDAQYSGRIERKYKSFVTTTDGPQRVFLKANIGHGEFTYQFDFNDLCDSHTSADGPPSHPLCCIAGKITSQKTSRSRAIRRCCSADAAALVEARRKLIKSTMTLQQVWRTRL